MNILQALFADKAKLNEQITELEMDKEVAEVELDALRDERTKLKEDLADLKLQKKIEDEDIKHMVKMERERLELDFEKRTVEIEGEKQDAIGEVKDKYRDKVEANLEKQLVSMKEMYGEILTRLPTVAVKMKSAAEIDNDAS